MTDRAELETEQRAALADMQRKVDAVQAAVTRISVRASSRNGELGVTVDAQGYVQDIRLTTRALQLGERRLARVLVETIQQADAARQARRAARPLAGDPRIAETMKEVRRMTSGRAEGESSLPRVMTEEQIQAADDAYFERMNRRGWRYSSPDSRAWAARSATAGDVLRDGARNDGDASWPKFETIWGS